MFTLLYTHICTHHTHAHTQRRKALCLAISQHMSWSCWWNTGHFNKNILWLCWEASLSNNHISESSHFYSILFQECCNTWQTLIHSHVYTLTTVRGITILRCSGPGLIQCNSSQGTCQETHGPVSIIHVPGHETAPGARQQVPFSLSLSPVVDWATTLVLSVLSKVVTSSLHFDLSLIS